jgi:hypothetical protein
MPIDKALIAAEIDPDILFADGWDEAFIGLTANHHHAIVAVYDYDRIIEIMMERDGVTYEDAEDFVGFNIVGAYVGERTPIYVSKHGIIAAGEPAAADADRVAAGKSDQSGVARSLIRLEPERKGLSGDIVELLEKYCHHFDASQIHEVCNRAAYVIKGLRASVQHYKQKKSLSKQVEALERRLEATDRELHRSMVK